MSEAPPKKESVESKKAKERREEQEFLEKRNGQLLDAQKANEILEEQLRSTRSTIKRCDVLLDHSEGFYEELAKLVKGKTLVGVTDLTVERANDIIQDAKEIVEGDVHLDRIKKFVPAGDNPVYPDVLFTVRSVRDSLERGRKELKSQVRALLGKLQKVRTLMGALTCFLEDTETEVSERDAYSKEALEPYVEGTLCESCFSQYEDSYEYYFDFDKLDLQSVRAYLSMTEDSGKEEAVAEGVEDEAGQDSGDNFADEEDEGGGGGA